MSVKILGGKARGYPLATPKSDATRPTSIMIRRKIFDWRQHMDDYYFVDHYVRNMLISMHTVQLVMAINMTTCVLIVYISVRVVLLVTNKTCFLFFGNFSALNINNDAGMVVP
jgi:hypothetical protein